MSYQVLARKWRPRSFSEMVGQEHVLKALINALDHNRLHHAYLFTGTRGVGKTTVARILAKCLNCETGVGSSPCGVCSACVQIAEGRFVDLIEVDAASRTKVEDTRDLLDNVQYAPTNARFKIYLIDEVHMLSNSSFNALLKTLEEPPEHVKFLLATTDPQKLPATVLSRCLQFNLKNMSPEKIVHHLHSVLKEETIPFEEAALWQLARSADGSMRDALSLTDQSIAFGNGQVGETDVASMLGTIDQRFIQRVVEALVGQDGQDIMQAVAQFSEHSPDYGAAIDELQTLLHRIAIAQALPEALDNSYGDRSQILDYASQLAPEDVQLFYQTALIGKRDLHLNATARNGFEMMLLRMLAFKPQGVAELPTIALSRNNAEAKESGLKKPITQSAEAAPSGLRDMPGDAVVKAEEPPASPVSSTDMVDVTPVSAKAEVGQSKFDKKDSGSVTASVPSISGEAKREETRYSVEEKTESIPKGAKLRKISGSATLQKIDLHSFDASMWIDLFRQIGLSGVLVMTASNLVCTGYKEGVFSFVQDEQASNFLNTEHASRLGEVLSEYFASPIKVDITVSVLPEGQESPAQYRERRARERREQALQDLKSDGVFQSLQREFGACLDEETLAIEDKE